MTSHFEGVAERKRDSRIQNRLLENTRQAYWIFLAPVIAAIL